jgi:hypothetical protein
VVDQRSLSRLTGFDVITFQHGRRRHLVLGELPSRPLSKYSFRFHYRQVGANYPDYITIFGGNWSASRKTETNERLQARIIGRFGALANSRAPKIRLKANNAGKIIEIRLAHFLSSIAISSGNNRNIVTQFQGSMARLSS